MATNRDKHTAIAEAFGRTTDPLAEFDDQFTSLDVDPFDLWFEEQVYTRDYAEDTVVTFERRVRQWKEFMADRYDRHPACASDQHAIEFANFYLNKGNAESTVAAKLGTLGKAYSYFQSEPAFPHGNDFNPFTAAKGKIDLRGDDPKEPRPIPLSDLCRVFQDEIKHIRDRAMILTGFKLGLRASEVSNILISEANIANSELQSHYDELGTHPALEGRPNAVYIPHDRKRNKRDRPTVLPIDDELRRVLLQYLLCRPDNGEPWLFLSKSGGKRVDHTNINDVWKKYFRPEYGPTDRFRGVSSHYGRHYFTTYFRIDRNGPAT